MADAPVFDRVCDELEQKSSLSRLEARGTLRLALKEAGLEAAAVTVPQMTVVLRKVLPAELASRSVAGAAALCEALVGCLSGLAAGPDAAETPEAVFARLATR